MNRILSPLSYTIFLEMLLLTLSILPFLPFRQISIDTDLAISTIFQHIPVVILAIAFSIIIHRAHLFPEKWQKTVITISTNLRLLLVTFLVISYLTVCILYLSYAATATDRPLMDIWLARVDDWIGFDWIAYTTILNSQPFVAHALSTCYFSLKTQMLIVPVILAFSARKVRLLEFVAQFGLTGFITLVMLAIFPAAGTFEFYNPPPEILSSFSNGASLRHLEQLHALRSHEPFIITQAEGLVTFPSFHTTLALLFAYSVRGVRYVAIPVYLLNAMLILATPPEGGHYLIDVIAGAIIAVVGVRLVRRIGRSTPDLLKAPVESIRSPASSGQSVP